MAQDRRDLYSILQVQPDADPEIIEAAFRALAEKYRLGPEASSEAAERLQDMQAAYSVLGNTRLRSIYDRLLSTGVLISNGHAAPSPAANGHAPSAYATGLTAPLGETGNEDRLACQSCGHVGPDLRYVTYSWAAGSPLRPAPRVATPVLCRRHRRSRGLAYAALAGATGLVNGWRHPTKRVRGAQRNLRGGVLPAYSNARLQRRLALDYLARQDVASAALCLRQSLEFQQNEAVTHLLERLVAVGAPAAAAPAAPRERRRRSLRPLLGGALVASLLVVASVSILGLLAATQPMAPAAQARSSDPLRTSPLTKEMVQAEPNDTPFRTDAYYLSLVRLLERLDIARNEYELQVAGIATVADAEESPTFIRASRAFGDQLMTLVDDLTALGTPPPELAEFHNLTEDLLVLRAAIAFDVTIAARSADERRWTDAALRQREFEAIFRNWQAATAALGKKGPN